MLETKIEELTAQIKLLINTIDNMGALRIPVQNVITSDLSTKYNNDESVKTAKETKPSLFDEKSEEVQKSVVSDSNTPTHDEIKDKILTIVRKDRSKKEGVKSLLESYGASLVKDLLTKDLSEFDKKLEEL